MLKQLKFLALFVMIGSAIGLAVPVYAQTAPVDPGQITDLRGALTWIIAAGASVIGSFLVDRIKFLDTLDTGLRMFAVLVASLILTTLARLALQFVPESWFAVADVYFRDWLPYITGALAMYATKSLRNGVSKAKTLTQIGASPYNS